MGIVVIPVVLLYILFVVLISKIVQRYSKRKLYGRMVLFVFFALPFADEWLGYIYLQYIGITQASTKIYKVVEDIQEQKNYWFTSNFSDTEYKYAQEYRNKISGPEYKERMKIFDKETEMEEILKNTKIP